MNEHPLGALNGIVPAEVVKHMFDAFIAETMLDPDIAAQSDDYRAGFKRAAAELTKVLIEMMLSRELVLNGHSR